MTVIRRVPSDFDWPLHKVWGGFTTPETLRLPRCPDCRHDRSQSSGLSAAAWAIDESFYATDAPEPMRSRIAWHDKITQPEVDHLLKKNRLPTWVPGPDGGRGGWETLPRTAEEVNALQRDTLNAHDGLSHWLLVKYRCKRLRIDMNCPTCAGTAHTGTPEQVAALKAWEPTPIPTGDGWQAWEDISEGSPISPVFATRDGLVHWFTTGDSVYGVRRQPLTRPEAEALVNAGASVGTFASINGALVDGDKAVAAMTTDQS